MNTLPDKPSELIRVAIKDLQACRLDSKYIIRMDNTWHDGEFEDVCSICLAGAVMAKTFGLSPYSNLSPSYFRISGEDNKLYSLDAFRGGDVKGGMLRLNIPYNSKMDRTITDYSKNPDQFIEDMLKMSDDLEKEGY